MESRNKNLKARQAELENQIQVLIDKNIAQFEEKNAQIQGKPTKDQFGNTNLHFLATNGPIGPSQLTNVVLKFAKDINTKNKQGNTPLHFAVHKEKFDLVKVLLESGANTNAQNNDKVTPFHASIFKGNAEITKLLLKYGARKEILNEHGRTPYCHNDNTEALLKQT